MRRFKLFVSVILIITLLFCLRINALGISESRTTVFLDSTGIFACETDSSSVRVIGINNNSNIRYTFNSKVMSCCFSNGWLYALMPYSQADKCVIAKAANGKITKELVLDCSRVTSDSRILADRSGRIYITDKRKRVNVFDKNGNSLGTTSNAYLSVAIVNGSVYASNASGIYRLDGKYEILICDTRTDDAIYDAGGGYLATYSGRVYNAQSGKLVLSTGVSKMYGVAASSSCFSVLDVSSLKLYKKNGESVGEQPLGYNPYAVCSDGSKICLVKNTSSSISVEKHSESYFLSNNSTKSDTNVAAPTGIDFGKYKVSGKYIYLEPLTTRAEFRSEVKFDGYKLSFNKSRGLGTGTKATFSKVNKESIYTIIVMGDITGTGRVVKRDVNLLIDCMFGVDKVSGVYKTAADMNGDGKLSNIDLVMMDRKRN